MATIPVVVKHSGKKYDLDLDTSLPGEVFKMQIYSVTGVEPDRQKVLIKGGQLKDDTDMSSLNLKSGHAFMMMGTPSGAGIVKAPQNIKFLEDMTEKDLAKVKGAIPSGLHNLGNTCYMNSTLQTLRSVPELHQELQKYSAGGQSGGASFSGAANPLLSFMGGSSSSNDLTGSLRDLFQQMSDTTEGFPPVKFVQALRAAFPQFDQRDRTGNYAQQDAEECYSQILSVLKQRLGAPPEGADQSKFIDKYFGGRMKTSTKCNEDEEEPAQEGEEPFVKLNCHISVSVNHLKDGILAGLTEEIEKRSEKLGRDAVYTKTSKVTRLPKYLTCHFVRFFWKKDINKKAKIMRKVTFPFQLDATDFCTDELKQKIVPVREKLRELHRNEEDRRKQKRKARTVFIDPTEENKDGDKMEVDGQNPTDKPKSSKSLEEEEDWDTALAPLLDDEISADIGANHSALYELQAIITHQGASADSGHYCAYVRKSDDDEEEEQDSNGKGKRKAPAGGLAGGGGAEASTWWFFNDEKVTEVGWDRIETLAGGGEAHSALVLLYRALDMTPKSKKKAIS